MNNLIQCLKEQLSHSNNLKYLSIIFNFVDTYLIFNSFFKIKEFIVTIIIFKNIPVEELSFSNLKELTIIYKQTKNANLENNLALLLRKATSLQVLEMKQIQLTELIKEIRNLINLVELNLCQNQLYDYQRTM
ncbi:hypothetical protein BCR36DRAFT_375992 [Piromyces finnis]|uniref:L domain-like protein n=1 Tax=Piromyces finnis TaxID=1754191 RepID=A0A1Y1U5H5_9FUNG|nr:hypothetical protein BCR36DRAFT_375992 [Piromyces finnis]|eukprot:ORX33283.1 hypothetical protein BCR36DRAFT_375992 [Piromyces finnis]